MIENLKSFNIDPIFIKPSRIEAEASLDYFPFPASKSF